MKRMLAAVIASTVISWPTLSAAQAIVVDGNILDWAGRTNLVVDAAGDGPFNSTGQYAAGGDFQSITVANDFTNVYLLLEFAGNHSGGIVLFLDTDQNPTTGCNGSEFAIFTSGSEPGGHLALADYRSCQVNNDFPGIVRSLPPHGVSRFLEASIPLAVLRTITPNLSGFVLSGTAVAPPIPGVNDVVSSAAYALESFGCQITLNQEVFTNGQTVIATNIRLVNEGPLATPVEIKIWFEHPGLAPIPIYRAGADGSAVLPAESNTNLGPGNLFTVLPSYTRGNYAFSCRIVNPVTGLLLGESLKAFVVQ